MSFDAKTLYELLPAIYRIRDSERDGALQELLHVIADQAAVLEENIEQLYDDQFIETSAEWVVPYIGDLIGYRSLHSKAARYLSSRAEVANTIAYRRRKGTATMLEQMARDVTLWPARVVEFFQLLATTQFMNHIRPANYYAPDLRNWESLERLNGPFESVAHTADVRRIATDLGRYNIPNIGIFLWRLQAYPLTDSPAVPVDDRRFFFSPLGHDAPLFTRPEAEDDISHLAEPINVPNPISRRVLDAYLDLYYGAQKSIFVRINGVDIATGDIKVCDLSDDGGAWAHEPDDKITIDPVLGRLALPPGFGVFPEVSVSYHYGFSMDLGGGEYERGATFDHELTTVQNVSAPATIQNALTTLGGSGVVQIGDSGRYEETLAVHVSANDRIELRADNENRPTLVLGGDMEITGDNDGVVTLNGLLITGSRIIVPEVGSDLRLLRLRHCTLVPGISLDEGGEPVQPTAESLSIELPGVAVEIEHCIVGGLRVVEAADVSIHNSIVDATDPEHIAFCALDGAGPGGALELVNTTVIGKLHTRMLNLASNTIFDSALAAADPWPAPVHSQRKQSGCVRFSYVPPGSRLPRRYRCQPELAIRRAITDAEKESGSLSSAEKAQIAERVAAWLKPVFRDRRYGQPGYAQLALSCPVEIKQGADDESEMGAYHNLYQPQRETNLRVRLDEYLRFGLQAGVFYVN